VERRTFDSKNPPENMPKLVPPEAAVCAYQFECDTRLGVELPRFGFKNITATVNSSEFNIRLKIIIWTPENTTPELTAHEETHREICELFYADGGPLAERLAAQVIGRKITVAKKSHESEIEAQLRIIQTELQNEYLAATAGRCGFAQQRFDVISNHGLNPITNEAAKNQALADEKAARK